MLSVKELRALSSRLSAARFRQQLGPFVLIQRPEAGSPSDTNKMGLPAAAARTTVAKKDSATLGTLGLLFQFDDLVVATLPPLHGVDELSVGRQPDNDLVLDHPSVSKKHALFRWDGLNNRCTLQDAGSTNGTFLNASVRLKKELLLRNGDIVSFGEVQYWFLLTETLYEKLVTAPNRGAPST